MSIPCDAWGLDVVASGSQKAFMLPPGLAFAMMGARAWEANATAKMPRSYFDLKAAKKSLEKGQTPFTPNVSMIRALGVALDLMLGEGLDNVWRRHHALANACRAWVKASGLDLLADEPHCSDVVTAVRSPEGTSSKDLVSRVRDNHRILISGGQGDLAGKIFRIGHMGCCQLDGLLRTLEATSLELQGLGFATDLAVGLDAARAAYKAGL
jgi:aspartate aminotransferase-like enzyme